VRRHGFYTGGTTGYSPPAPDPDPDPLTVEFAWVGNVSGTGATIKARIPEAASTSLRYSTNPDLSGGSTVSGTEGADEMWTFALSGLSAATRYYYGWTNASLTGSFRTFPTSGNFLIATASCAGTTGATYPGSTPRTSNAPTFDRIRDRDPALFIHMGDRHYRDIGSNNVSAYRLAYQNVLANQRQKDLHLAVPVAYAWDDHDFGSDDSYSASASKPAAQQTYREHVPHWPLPESDSIQQTFTVGRVRFILLDCRSYRSSNTATDNSSKTALGAIQKAWLKSTLLAATEPCIVVAVQMGWIGSNLTQFTWGVYGTERRELAEFFEDNGLTSRLILINGDNHFIAADDGTNSQYDPDAVTLGPLCLNAAPMDAGFTSSFGTWSTGIFKTRKQQYATIDFADTGTQITATIKGWALSASPGATESQLFSVSKVFAG
jgi:phosphodiesterase/alkaline phosphatase D-like protein